MPKKIHRIALNARMYEAMTKARTEHYLDALFELTAIMERIERDGEINEADYKYLQDYLAKEVATNQATNQATERTWNGSTPVTNYSRG